MRRRFVRRKSKGASVSPPRRIKQRRDVESRSILVTEAEVDYLIKLASRPGWAYKGMLRRLQDIKTLFVLEADKLLELTKRVRGNAFWVEPISANERIVKGNRKNKPGPCPDIVDKIPTADELNRALEKERIAANVITGKKRRKKAVRGE